METKINSVVALEVNADSYDIKLIDIPTDYESLCAKIGHKTITVLPLAHGAVAICQAGFSELINREFNDRAIVGQVFIVLGTTAHGYCGLSAEQINFYTKYFGGDESL